MTFAAGEKLKVTADCGVRNDDDASVPSIELRGAEVTVCGANAHYKHAETGEDMVGVTHRNGALSAIPARALSRAPRRSGASQGYDAGYAAAYEEIFGSGH